MESGGGGGELIRRVNVVYFLSRDGKVEHPHLIRIHHRSSGGVRLRDVKRWLSDLRGKDMPDSFAWSYKRQYRTGYVWQDVKDDDFITPISDNEYVLKGSLIPSSPSSDLTKLGVFSSEERTPSRGNGPAEGEAGPRAETLAIEADDGVSSPKPPPRLDEESAGRAAVFKMDLPEKQPAGEREAPLVGENRSSSTTTTSRRASHVFRSILTCRIVDTNDSALRPNGQRDRNRLASSAAAAAGGGAGPLAPHRQNPNTSNCRSTSGGKSSRKAGEKAVPAVYKPTAAPNCSQCGKAFRPEKLHSHMKSCKALKSGRGKSSTKPEFQTLVSA